MAYGGISRELLASKPLAASRCGTGCMMFPRMLCPDKENLQQKCTTAWETYEEEVKKSGLGLTPGSGWPIWSSSSISELMRVGWHFDPETQKPAISPAYAAALRLRGEHLKASAELSRHLSRHRC